MRFVAVVFVVCVLMLGALAVLVRPPVFDPFAPYRQANGTIKLTGADYNAIRQYLSPPPMPKTIWTVVPERDEFGILHMVGKEVPNPAYHSAAEQPAQPGLLSGLFAGPAPDILGMLRGAVNSFLNLFTFNAAASGCNGTGNCYWHSTSSASWSNTADWYTGTGGSGTSGSLPATTDNVWFDSSSCASAITISLAAATEVAGFSLANSDCTVDTTSAHSYALTVDSDFTMSAGTFLAEASAIAVSGNWDTSGAGSTFIGGTSTVTFAYWSEISLLNSSNGFHSLRVSAGHGAELNTNLYVAHNLTVDAGAYLGMGYNSDTGTNYDIIFGGTLGVADTGLVVTSGAEATNFTITHSDSAARITLSAINSWSDDNVFNWVDSDSKAADTITFTIDGNTAGSWFEVLKNDNDFISGMANGSGEVVFQMLGSDPTVEVDVAPYGSGCSTACYWVGGSSSDWSNGNNWASTSGGTNVGAVPTSMGDVYFDSNSGTGTVILDTASVEISLLDMTGYAGTLSIGANSLSVYYGVTIGGTLTMTSGTLDASYDLHINSGGTLTATGAANISTSAWDSSAGTFNAGTSTVWFEGAMDQANPIALADGSHGFYNCMIDGAVNELDSTLWVSNALTVDGTLVFNEPIVFNSLSTVYNGRYGTIWDSFPVYDLAITNSGSGLTTISSFTEWGPVNYTWSDSISSGTDTFTISGVWSMDNSFSVYKNGTLFYNGTIASGSATFTMLYSDPTVNVYFPSCSTFYWVGGTGDWNDTSHWVSTSGGSTSCATYPISSPDAVVFDDHSGGGTTTVPDGTGAEVDSLTMTGYTGTLSFLGDSPLYDWGNLTIAGTLSMTTGAVWVSGNWDSSNGTFVAGTGGTTFGSWSGTQTLKTASPFGDVTITGDVVLQSAVTMGNLVIYTSYLSPITGTLDTSNSNYALSIKSLSLNPYQDDPQMIGGTLIANGSTITVTGNWDTSGAGSVFAAGSSTVTMNGTSKTVNLNGTAGFSNLTISGSVTADDSIYVARTLTVTGAFTVTGYDIQFNVLTDSVGTIVAVVGSATFDITHFTVTNSETTNLVAITAWSVWSANDEFAWTDSRTEGTATVTYTFTNVTNGSTWVTTEDGNAYTSGTVASNAFSFTFTGDTGSHVWDTLIISPPPGCSTACYWVGGSSSDWSDGNNWASTSGGTNVGAVPTAMSDVYFDSNSGTGTVLLTGAVTVAGIDMTGYGGTLDTTTNNYSLTINGNFTIGGTFKANRSAISVSGDWIDSGTFLRGQAQVRISGSGVTVSESNGFYDLTISGTVRMATDLNVFNTLATSGLGVLTTGGNSITGGAALSLVGTGGLTASTSTLAFGDVTVGTGTTFSLTSGSVSVSGNWSDSGTFTRGTSTVTLSGTSKAVSETNGFYNLTVSGAITAGSAISASDTLIITGTFTVTGYNIQFNALTDSTGTIVSGAVSVTNFTITDSDATNLITITAWTTWTTNAEYKWTDSRTESTATVTYTIAGVTNGKAWATTRDGSAYAAGTVSGGSFSFMVTGDTSAHFWDTVITSSRPPVTGAAGGPGFPFWVWPLVVVGIAVVIAVAVMLFRRRKATPEPSLPEAPQQ